MSPPAKRRRLSEDADSLEQGKTGIEDQDVGVAHEQNTDTKVGSPKPSRDATSSNPRLAKFAALKARATESARVNLAETRAEATRSAYDPEALSKLRRRADVAEQNLLKADLDDEGGKGTFERKRAWDYTVEESEKWDRRMARKKEARENNSFQDFTADAARVYERQVGQIERAKKAEGGDEYAETKRRMIEEAARGRGLEVVELDSGEVVAIDRDGRFFANGGDNGFHEQKPSKASVDRLVADMRKAEEVRIRKDKQRKGEQGDPDVTYINEANKHFNKRLSRFYDRYTSDIRENFERGTAI